MEMTGETLKKALENSVCNFFFLNINLYEI